MTDKIDAGSGENDGGGEQDSGAEQVAEDEFDAVIVPGFGLGRVRLWGGRLSGGHQIFPHNPL
jgi:hypothetical protein